MTELVIKAKLEHPRMVHSYSVRKHRECRRAKQHSFVNNLKRKSVYRATAGKSYYKYD